jgi:hypothetical protein
MSDEDAFNLHENVTETEGNDLEDDSIMNVLADLGEGESDAEVKAYRVDPKAKNTKGGAYLFTCLPAEFSLDRLRDDYGGGAFRIHVRCSGRILTNKLVAVEPPIKTVVNPLNQNDILSVVQQTIKENNEMLLRMLQPQASSKKEMMEEMVMYKQLFGNDNKSSGGNPEDFMRYFFDGMKMGKEMNSPEIEPTGLTAIMNTVKEFAPALTALTMKEVNQPQPAPVQTQPQIPQQTGPQYTDFESFILKMCYKAAKKKSDPELFAETCIDTFEHAEVVGLLSNPDWLKMCISHNADIQAYTEWYSEFKIAVMEMYENDGDNTIQPGEDDEMMKKYVIQLCDECSKGTDVNSMVDVTIENVPAIMLRGMVNDPNIMDKLRSHDVRVGMNVEWFTTYLNSIKNHFIVK